MVFKIRNSIFIILLNLILLIQFGCVTSNTKVSESDEISYRQNFKAISPDNDGVQDELILTVDSPSNLSAIYWKFEITDAEGDIVRIKGSDKDPEELKASLIPPEEISLPNEVTWKGSHEFGGVVQDGEYHFSLIIMKRNFETEEEEGRVLIDTKDPQYTLNLTNEVFSPNNDGNKDNLIIDINFIRSEEEGMYLSGKYNYPLYAYIMDMQQNVVKEYQMDGPGQETFRWDGKNMDNQQIDDGIYTLQVRSTDPAGNTVRSKKIKIRVDTETDPVSISSEEGVFSPNGDGVKDKINFTTNLEDETGITGWSVYIINSQTDEREVIAEGTEVPPKTITWDGSLKSGIAEEGLYRARLEVKYNNGNISTAQSQKTEIDTTAPVGEITIKQPIFSPNDDGVKDTVRISQTTSSEKNPWKGQIVTQENQTVKTYTWEEEVPREFSWSGQNDAGEKLADGVYKYKISCTDLAGNSFESVFHNISLDTNAPEITIEKTQEYFSPDNDGKQDELQFNFLASSDMTGISNWELIIYEKDGENVFTSFSGNEIPENNIVWKGRNDEGEKVESATEYPVEFSVEDKAGNRITKELDPVIVDILVNKIAEDRYKLRISNIEFKPESPEFSENKANIEIIKRLASVLNQFPDHNIRIEGYANEWKKGLDPEEARILSQNRAQKVADKLVENSVNEERITVVGRGFENPIIPLREDMSFEEVKDMAINRRVEFYLDRS